ncbi:hypothetical protein [Cupriavidus sp. CP313]
MHISINDRRRAGIYPATEKAQVDAGHIQLAIGEHALQVPDGKVGRHNALGRLSDGHVCERAYMQENIAPLIRLQDGIMKGWPDSTASINRTLPSCKAGSVAMNIF